MMSEKNREKIGIFAKNAVALSHLAPLPSPLPCPLSFNRLSPLPTYPSPTPYSQRPQFQQPVRAGWERGLEKEICYYAQDTQYLFPIYFCSNVIQTFLC